MTESIIFVVVDVETIVDQYPGVTGSIISVVVGVEAIVDQECVYHERIVPNEICRAMKEAMQQQLNPNHYWRTDIEGLEKPVIQEGDIMSH